MRELTTLIIALLALYLLLAIFVYLIQRSLIYYPVPSDPGFPAREITLDNNGTRLHGWVLNPDKDKAMVYFGGNAEQVTGNQGIFQDLFRDYSVYLVNYRGYGDSEGRPSEAALFADALAIYDQARSHHDAISAFGRSLGSGVAVYLATQRPLERLILLAPYDSITALAQRAYPIFPVRWLLKDRFDSVSRAALVRVPVLIIAAERDRIVPSSHSHKLSRALVNAPVNWALIDGAAHNDVTAFPAFGKAVRKFTRDEDQA